MGDRRYVARVGMSYVPRDGKREVRREIGDAVDDLPVDAIAGLLEGGAIETMTTGAAEPPTKEE